MRAAADVFQTNRNRPAAEKPHENRIIISGDEGLYFTAPRFFAADKAFPFCFPDILLHTGSCPGKIPREKRARKNCNFPPRALAIGARFLYNESKAIVKNLSAPPAWLRDGAVWGEDRGGSWGTRVCRNALAGAACGGSGKKAGRSTFLCRPEPSGKKITKGASHYDVFS